MKPVLVSEHENEAVAFIQEIESDYLTLVRSIISEIKNLGLTPTETIVRAVLIEGPEILRGKYGQYAERDISPGSTDAAKAQMRNLHHEVFAGFLQKLNPFFETTIGGKPVKNPMFQDLITFDKALRPLLPEAGKEKIREQFREYISDPRVLKIRNACAEAATGLQTFWQAMVKAGYASRFLIDYSESEHPGWMIEKQVLNVLSGFLTVTGADGQYVIEPRQMDFTNVELETIDDHGTE
ncbi:MAG: hypothetical protein WAV93_02490 [Bacteroidales bacterium]